jgi:hypothetical protein
VTRLALGIFSSRFLGCLLIRKLIQEALNKQTFHQFLAYAQQTHPGDQDKVSYCM